MQVSLCRYCKDSKEKLLLICYAADAVLIAELHTSGFPSLDSF